MNSALTFLTKLGKEMESLSEEDLTPKTFEQLRRQITLAEYYWTPKPGASFPEVDPSWKSCSTKGCKNSSREIYFVKNDWYCFDHIPRDVIFPIGLHGEDFRK